MKLTVLQEDLSKALSLTGRFIASHPQLPILSNYYLKAKKNRLLISATNLETGINYSLGAKVEEDGETTVTAKTFSKFVSSLPADKVSLTSNKEGLKVQCEQFRANLPTTPPADYPEIPTKVEQRISLPLEKFVQAVSQVVFAASSDETRPVLSGVHFQFNDSKCLLSATDGYRLSFKEITLEEEYPELDFIIPARILAELTNLKLDQTDTFELGLSEEEKQAVFFLPNIEFSSRLLEGEFPNIDEVIPQDKTTTVTTNREELLHIIRTSAIFARESANIVKLDFSDDKITASANAPGLGENQNSLEAKIEGEGQKSAFNFRFLLDLLQNIEAEELKIELNGSLKPAAFKIPEEKSFLHIIMPVRIQEEE